MDGMMVEGNATKFCAIAIKLDGGDTVQFGLNDDRSGTFLQNFFQHVLNSTSFQDSCLVLFPNFIMWISCFKCRETGK